MIRFHERLGFVEVARLPEVGVKFGRWLDLVLLQLRLAIEGHRPMGDGAGLSDTRQPVLRLRSRP